VGGVSPMSGVKKASGPTEDPSVSKREIEDLRAAIHDMRRRRGEEAQRFDNGRLRRKKRAARGTGWHADFLKAIERTGSRRQACRLAGISRSTMQNHFHAHPELREQADDRFANWAWRQLKYDAKKSKFLAAILWYVQRELAKANAAE
jgi:hypothetical protein